jgi:hypothetical protein
MGRPRVRCRRDGADVLGVVSGPRTVLSHDAPPHSLAGFVLCYYKKFDVFAAFRGPGEDAADDADDDA